MDQWTDRLSEYLDGELAAPECAEVDAHLGQCPECRGILEELRAVVTRGAHLADRPPATDLWPALAARLGLEADETPVLRLDRAPSRPGARRISVSWPQLAAAAVALMAVSVGVSLVVSERAGRAGAVASGETVAGLASPASVRARPSYDQAIRDLEAVLVGGRGRLDTATVRVLEQSLTRIDAAIAEARRAVAADPASAYLNTHLAETMRRKLDLLRRAAALTSAEL